MGIGTRMVIQYTVKTCSDTCYLRTRLFNLPSFILMFHRPLGLRLTSLTLRNKWISGIMLLTVTNLRVGRVNIFLRIILVIILKNFYQGAHGQLWIPPSQNSYVYPVTSMSVITRRSRQPQRELQALLLLSQGNQGRKLQIHLLAWRFLWRLRYLARQLCRP